MLAALSPCRPGGDHNWQQAAPGAAALVCPRCGLEARLPTDAADLAPGLASLGPVLAILGGASALVQLAAAALLDGNPLERDEVGAVLSAMIAPLFPEGTQERVSTALAAGDAEALLDVARAIQGSSSATLHEERRAALQLALADLDVALKNLAQLDPTDPQRNELRAAQGALGGLWGTLRGLGLVTPRQAAEGSSTTEAEPSGSTSEGGGLAAGMDALVSLLGLQPCGCESAQDGTPLKRCAEHGGAPPGPERATSDETERRIGAHVAALQVGVFAPGALGRRGAQ